MDIPISNFSFYTDAQAFQDFHAYTSYYRLGQEYFVDLIQAQPDQLIIELGCAVGDTSRAIARRYPQSTVLGIDFRQDMADEAARLTQEAQITNARFKQGDMTQLSEFIPWQDRLPAVLCSLYSFHHIPDPIADKYAFAQEVAALPCEHLRVVIMDEITDFSSDDPQYAEATCQQWRAIAQEAYRSVFINRYTELIRDGIPHAQAHEMADISAAYTRDIELALGQTTAQRHDEFPVTESQMMDIWLDAGFNVEFHAKLNALGDHLFVFTK